MKLRILLLTSVMSPQHCIWKRSTSHSQQNYIFSKYWWYQFFFMPHCSRYEVGKYVSPQISLTDPQHQMIPAMACHQCGYSVTHQSSSHTEHTAQLSYKPARTVPIRKICRRSCSLSFQTSRKQLYQFSHPQPAVETSATLLMSS